MTSPARSPQRVALASAIAERGACAHWLARVEDASKAAMNQAIDARERLEAAKLDIAEARKISPEELVAMALDEAARKPLKETEARAKVRQLEDEIENRTHAREAIDAELLRARDSLDSISRKVREAVAATIRSEPAVAQLVNDYQTALRTVVEARLSLDYLASQNALDEAREGCLREVPLFLATRTTTICDRWAGLDGASEWKSFVKALEKDADAELS
jgi:hypothetical protein